MSIPSDFHAPTLPTRVPQPATSTSTMTSSSTSLQSELEQLSTERSNLTQELQTYSQTLLSNGCDMQTPLVDRQGFPRSDIDVASVRVARNRIICLRNDLKELERKIESVLERGLGRQDRDTIRNGQDEQGRSRQDESREADRRKEPFARVDKVAPNSPASNAGLQPSDLLLSINEIDSTNHDQLKAVGQLVASSENVELHLKIKRGEYELSLRLVPRSGWGGRGLLGFVHPIPQPVSSVIRASAKGW